MTKQVGGQPSPNTEAVKSSFIDAQDSFRAPGNPAATAENEVSTTPPSKRRATDHRTRRQLTQRLKESETKVAANAPGSNLNQPIAPGQLSKIINEGLAKALDSELLTPEEKKLAGAHINNLEETDDPRVNAMNCSIALFYLGELVGRKTNRAKGFVQDNWSDSPGGGRASHSMPPELQSDLAAVSESKANIERDQDVLRWYGVDDRHVDAILEEKKETDRTTQQESERKRASAPEAKPHPAPSAGPEGSHQGERPSGAPLRQPAPSGAHHAAPGAAHWAGHHDPTPSLQELFPFHPLSSGKHPADMTPREAAAMQAHQIREALLAEMMIKQMEMVAAMIKKALDAAVRAVS